MLSPLDRLVALEDIKTVRLRFCRLLDGRKWDDLGKLMTENAELTVADDSGLGELPGGKMVLSGRDTAIAFMKEFVGEGRIIHIATMPEIEFHGDDKAHGIWRLEGYSERVKERGMIGVGYETLEEDYERIGDKWLLTNILATFEAIF